MLPRPRTKFYRFLEILPGAVTWLTLIGAVSLSYFAPFWIAIYIIVFDIYWVLKAINTAMHLLSSFGKLKLHFRYDWRQRLEELKDIQKYKQNLRAELIRSTERKIKSDLKEELFRLDAVDFTHRILDYREIYHLVILPTYKESLEVLDNSIRSVLDSEYPKDRIFLVLATEERDYDLAMVNSRILRERYADKFLRFETVMHPDGVPGEAKTKGANMNFAGRQAIATLEALNIP